MVLIGNYLLTPFNFSPNQYQRQNINIDYLLKTIEYYIHLFYSHSIVAGGLEEIS